jgi:hypothetical protein
MESVELLQHFLRNKTVTTLNSSSFFWANNWRCCVYCRWLGSNNANEDDLSSCFPREMAVFPFWRKASARNTIAKKLTNQKR